MRRAIQIDVFTFFTIYIETDDDDWLLCLITVHVSNITDSHPAGEQSD